MNTKLTSRLQARCLVSALGLTTFILFSETGRAALPEGRSLDIEIQGTGVRLSWLSITNALYEVQARTNLVQGNWGVLDTIVNAGGVTVYPVTPDDSPSRFFRVLFPQPVVTAGEPARTTTGTGGSYLYISGAFFYAGDQVSVGGILASNLVFVSPSLLRVELPPGLPPGRYDVAVLSAHTGAVLASLHEAVTVVDLAADPTGLLYGPPEEPPASPKKTADHAKAAADRAKASALYRSTSALSNPSGSRKGINEKGLPIFDDSSAGISVPDSDKGINQPGLKLFDGSSAVVFVEEKGKKGLNAVNVKLARTAGSVAGITAGAVAGIAIAVRDCGANAPTVSAFSGDVQACDVDLAIPGRGLDFVWARTYHSRLGRTGSATNGWTFSYDLHLQPLGGDILIHDGTGRADRFILQPSGVYTCPEFFREGTLSVAGVFRLTFADTGYWEFLPLGTSPAAGKLDRIVDRNGNTVSLSYDTAGRLSAVIDDLGRSHTVAYDTAGRLASVTDSFGRSVTYRYYAGLPSDPGGGLGDLKSVTSPPVTGTPTGNDFPEGKTTTYTYSAGSTAEPENHLLLSVADALGQTVVACAYDLDPASASYLRCTSLRRGSDAPTMFTYQPLTPTTENRFAALRCVANDPVGNVDEMLYDCRGRGIDKKDIRRRANPGQPITDTSALPIDKLRPEDPEFTVTRWSWNNDSLCTSATAPGGQEVRCTYQGDLEPSTPARKRADCRVVSEWASSPVDLDGDGTPDTSERVWLFDYDPRFGSDPAATRLRSGVIAEVGSGRPATVDYGPDSGPSELRESPTGPGQGGPRGGGTPKEDKKSPGRESPTLVRPPKGNNSHIFGNPASGGWTGFVTSSTDPRGNETTGSYDTNGNLTEVIKKHVANIKWCTRVYDVHGQLTAITNAPDVNGRCRVDTFAYSQGQVTACVVDAGADGLALTTAFEYDPRGNLTRCVDPRGNDWLYTYNSLDQCVRAQSPTNVSARCSTGYFYDANDNLVRCVTQVRDASDTLTGTCTDRASHDPLHRLIEVALAVDATHALTNRFIYDGNGQCVQILGGNAVSGVDPHHTVSFAYDTCGLLYREVAAPGSADQCTTQYNYDPNGLLTRVSEGLEETPSITTLAYDGFANEPEHEKWEGVLSVMGAKAKAWMANNFAALSGSEKGEGLTSLPRRLVVIVGGADRLSRVTDPMGNVTTFTYDANDNLTVARQFGELIDVPGSDGNIRLAESRCAYDGLDRCVVQRDLHFSLAAPQSPVGDGECTTAFAYAPNGACIDITNDLGGVTTASYDTAGRVYSVRVPGDKTLRVCLRDAAGNVTSVTQTDADALGGPPQSFSCTYVYDSRNRCVSSTDGAGKTTACAYDSLDRLVRFTDAAGTQTFQHYDLLGRCTATVGDLDGDGLEDFARDLTEQATWSSSNGRLLATTDSHGNTTSYEYDSLGRCTTVTCADGTQQQLVWSPRSNLIRETDANGSVITYTYDLNDCLGKKDIAIGLPNATTTFEAFSYDGCGRLTSHTNDTCGGAFAHDSLGGCVSETLNGLSTTSTYDALGNRLSLAYPGGRVLTYAYDASGCCTSIAESGAALASFAYDGVDRLARVTYGNGLRSTFEYDGLDGVQNAPGDHGFGQVSHLVHGSTNGATVKISHLSWDLKENKKARTMPPLGTGGSTNVLTLEYDLADRLVRSTVTEGTATLRDTTYSLDRMGNRTNVIGAACSGPYTLEPASPPADYQMNQYTATPCDSRAYDDNGNLVSRSAGTGSSLSFTYDYADRLVSVSDSGLPVASYTYDALGRRASKTIFSGSAQTTRRYCYDGSCVIEEREDNAVAASYVGACMSGQCVTMRRSGQDYYFLSDDQGNAVALTDASGAVVEGYDYDDYGAVTFLTSEGTPSGTTSSAFGNPYCWGGLRLDAETGLHNNDGGVYFETQVGRALEGSTPSVAAKHYITIPHNLQNVSHTGDSAPSMAAKHYITIPHNLQNISPPGGSSGSNPWSGGSPLGMKKGTVKFFNETKGFGRANQQKLDYVLNLIR